MHKLLDRLLQKRNIKDTSELGPEEKATFDRWNLVLAGGEVTVDKIAEFCKNQIGIIKREMRNSDNTLQKNNNLALILGVYDAISDLITSPDKERENLEKHLNQLLTS